MCAAVARWFVGNKMVSAGLEIDGVIDLSDVGTHAGHDGLFFAHAEQRTRGPSVRQTCITPNLQRLTGVALINFIASRRSANVKYTSARWKGVRLLARSK
jgi:hypothetical protein